MRIDRRLLLSRQQEKKGMARFGGSQSPRSGAGWSRKNDGRTDDELIEFKRTDSRHSIRLLADDLDALYRHAMAECRIPLLCFELRGKRWLVLPESDYHELAVHRHQPGDAIDLREDVPHLARPSQVPRIARKPVLRRVPAQQQPGPGSSQRVPRNPPGPPRPLPGPGGLSQLRHKQRGEVRGLGRVQRKGASPDQAPAEPATGP